MNCDVIMDHGGASLEARSDVIFEPCLSYTSEISWLTNSAAAPTGLERLEEKQQTPNMVRVLKASHVMYVGCDAGGRINDHKCGVLWTSRRHDIYLIIFLHLAFGPSKCKDNRVVKEGIQVQVAGDERSTRIGILL